MDLNEYSAIADKLNVELRGLTTKLIQNYKNEVNKNGETLKTLPFYHGFYFIGRNGKLLSDHHKMYIKINNSSQSDVYYSLDDKELTYLTYDSELGFKVPTPVSEESLHILFLDSEFYLDVMHIVGLSGLLKASATDTTNAIALLKEDLAEYLQ
ncbi:hypothetical protein ITQ84_09280 [Pediococcus pentosaceus]|uniref:hypothetical protein n=1 Tax=Pediococcus pentosaceus TaxID=1255 RepID=UPI0018A15199|nr:hypothetical protein [Pediococcus pentosaceus]MBF7140535.1 hypothetical protein [Pediococcus pentosaceus]